MRPRQLKALSLWIVPLLIARALIPTGFMLTADRGALELTFCPAGQYQSAAQHAGHAGHHADGGEHGGHNSDGADGTACPFSLVASAVSCDIPPLRVVAAAPVDEAFEFISAPTYGAGPLRADRIRGPPVLS